MFQPFHSTHSTRAAQLSTMTVNKPAKVIALASNKLRHQLND